MSMTKQQMIGSACAGVFVLCAGALGWFLYDAASGRAEIEEQLEAERSAFSGFNSSAVFPSKKSIADVKSNETSYVQWHASALELAARGDQPPPAPEEPSVFKQRLQSEIRRLAALPGGVEGRICAAGFLFGFEQYLGENGTLPQPTDVPRLAEQLATISRVVDMFAEVGVYEVKSLTRVEPRVDEEESTPKGKRKGGKGAEADAPTQKSLEYVLEITARPSAFVKVFNRLTSDVRFCVVRNLSFKQSSDAIVDKISAVESAAAQAASATSLASTRRRRRRAVEEEAPAAADQPAKVSDRIVSDPETDAPVLVKFTLDVFDFGQGAKPAAEAAASEKKEEK